MDTLGAAHSDTPSTSEEVAHHSEFTGAGQSRNESIAAGPTEPPSPRTVRLLFLSGAWGRISNARKFVLLFSVAIVIAQLGSITAALVISRDKTCDKPLDVFLIVYLVRSVVNLPLTTYHHLRPGRDQQRQQEDGQNNSRPRVDWSDRFKALLDIFGIVWFIIGNYFLFTSGGCAQEAPVLFVTTLVWILLGYLLILIPLFICASVIFCLPCVLVLMRILRLGYTSGLTEGATQEEIDAIPVYRYYAQPSATEGEQTGSTAIVRDEDSMQQDDTSTEQHPKRKISFFFKLLLRRSKKEEDPERAYEPLTITPIEDAMCSICLSDYEDKDLVCKLWCRHHFHRDCVYEWLLLNSSCPLCKRDSRNKDPEP